MSLPDPIPVPEQFWSFETDQPFEKCLVCSRNLLEEPVPYLIEKAYQRGEVILELAICTPCQMEMMQEFSATSLKLVQHFMGEHVDFGDRYRRFLDEFDGDLKPWLKKCMILGDEIKPDSEFRVAARCIGNTVDPGLPPHAVSMAALEAMMKVLSPQTKGFLNDFTERYFGVPAGEDVPSILPL
ncbi:MAG: hypothetical protein ACKVHO_00610 [Verrucomicrobiia bacterium]|jgi:hypothetical protein